MLKHILPICICWFTT